MPRLTLHLFGSPHLELDGVPIATDRRKALALLAYLAVTAAEGGQQSHSREALAALFWPEHDQSRAYAYLRRALWEINQTAGEGWVLADRETVSLNPDAGVWLDVTRFQSLLAEGRPANRDCAACLPLLTEAATLYQDHFLAGFSLKDAPGFEEWAFFQAEGLRRELGSALETLVHCHLEQHSAEDALPFARRWLALDTLNEAAHRELMRVYEQAGQHNAALRQYQECVRILRDELGATPQSETTALYERLRKEEARTVRAEPTFPRPTGTVTFLFTDIEGSTQLWEKHPGVMKTAHARHEAILRQAIAAHGGYAYKMIGDAFQVAFATAPKALAAALEAQRALHVEPWGETPIRVRMALHTGVTEERGDDYVGPVLNRVARLLGVGHGGQVLFTQTTYDLVRDQLPEGVSLRDLGERRLKDLVRAEHVYQLVAPDLPSDFPPLTTLDTFRHNLPVQLTSFVGREKEIAEIKRLITANRLTTLTGAGGSGKTRLALQVVREMLDAFPDGVWFIEFAPFSDPVLVPQIVVNTVGLIEQAGRSPQTVLTDFWQAKNALLLLDNCEHLVQACAQMAETLLRACPKLCMLATSREALGVPGEMTFLVPTLSTPDIRPSFAVETLTDYEAVQLFIERAQTTLSGFTLTNDNAPAIARVCHQLDGIPLAIELAAARVKLLRVEQIAARLDDRFRLLTSGSRMALPRHQTLQALIDWSHDLLSEPERVLLRRLSIFAGGWMLEAAEEVSSGQDLWSTVHDSLFTEDVLDLLTQLVNKSLVIAERRQGQETRYRMLETIRQYTREKLWSAGEGEVMRDRHLTYFLAFAERAEPELRGPEQVEWLDRLEIELDNLRAALEWSLETDIEAGLRLAGALLWFWQMRGHKSEGCEWLERMLSNEAVGRGDRPLLPARALLRGKALNVAATLRNMLQEVDKVSMLSEESVAIFRELGVEGKRGMAYALWNLTGVEPDLAQRKALYEESLALFREVEDKVGTAECLQMLTGINREEGNYEQARVIGEQNLALRKEMGDKVGIGTALIQLGRLARLQGDYQRATTLFDEGLALYREVGDKWAIGFAQTDLGILAWLQGDYGQAITRFEEALALDRDLGDKFSIASNLFDLGEVAWSQGDYGRAIKMLEEGLLIVREVGHRGAIADTLYRLGDVALAQGDYEQATKRFEAGLAIGREIESKLLIAIALYDFGKVALAQGDYRQATKRFEESLDVSRKAGDKRITSSALYGLGRVAQSQGDYVSARRLQAEAIEIYRIGDPGRLAGQLEALAALAAAQQEMTRATRLFGAAEAVYNLRFEMSPAEHAEHDRAITTARATVGEEAFAAAYAEGRAMTMEQAIAYALEAATKSVADQCTILLLTALICEVPVA